MIQVFLVKRFKRKRQRNGKREYRWALRWEGPDGWRCESTGHSRPDPGRGPTEAEVGRVEHPGGRTGRAGPGARESLMG